MNTQSANTEFKYGFNTTGKFHYGTSGAATGSHNPASTLNFDGNGLLPNAGSQPISSNETSTFLPMVSPRPPGFNIHNAASAQPRASSLLMPFGTRTIQPKSIGTKRTTNFPGPVCASGFVNTTTSLFLNSPPARPGTAPLSTSATVPNNTVPIPSSVQQEIPYISVDGRRKRRRTTFEDAFHQCLTMTMHEDNMFPRDEISTPVKDCNNDSMQYMDGNNDNSTAGAGARAFNYSSPIGTNTNSSPVDNEGVAEPQISKRLDYNKCDTSSTRRELPLFRMSSTDSIPDRKNDDDDASISSTDSDYNSSSSNDVTSSSSTPMHFAPRKAKKQMEHLDPVDERIEELIRHSRIKAMILSNRELERQNQRMGAHAKFKSQQMDEKEMDHGGDKVEGGSELRRKNEKEISAFTGISTDDSALSWSSGGRLSRGRGQARGSISPTSSVTLLNGDGGRQSSRSSSIPRGMKYSDFRDTDMSS